MIHVSEIAQLISGKIEGDASISIDTIRPVNAPQIAGGLAIVFSKKDIHSISETTADVLIGPAAICS
nr:UDP-3-O-(3-hydroxymyristoyl)glucosamine N-acyltransferase [Vibrio anguillarum]